MSSYYVIVLYSKHLQQDTISVNGEKTVDLLIDYSRVRQLLCIRRSQMLCLN